MNKIYRRLWSTARQCWVVASELTAPRGKAASTTAAVSAVLLAALLPDAGLQVAHATIYDSCQDPKQIIVNCVPFLGHDDRSGSTVGSGSGWFLMLGAGSYIQGNHSALFGSGSSSTGNHNAVFGNEAHAFMGYSTVLGAKAKADGEGAVSVGHDSLSSGLNSIAVGSGARTSMGAGHSRIAIGGNAQAGSAGWTGGMAIGGYALSTFDGVALGYGAQATAAGSIALGAHSVADQGNTVSVGRFNGERRIVNVKDGNLGSNSTDAVNGRQLQGVIDTVSGVSRVANSAQSIATTALNNTKLVQVVGGLIHVGREQGGNVLTVSNKDGGKRYVNGVQNATLSASSSDAVTGQQLFATNNTLGTVQATANQAKVTADLGLSKAEWLGRLISGGPTGGVQIGAENAGSLLSVRNQTGGRRVITGLHNADLSGASTEAVTGQQLFATNNNVATAQLAADTALGKVNSLGGLVSQAAGNGNVRLGAENTGAVLDVRNKSNANRTLSGLKDGALNATSAEAVTGKQLNTTNTEVASVRTVATAAQTTANTAKTTADNALGKANTVGGLVSQTAADGNVRLGGENTGLVLDVRNKSGGARSLSGLADGAINASSTEAVTGKQLQATHDRLATAQSRADAAHAGATAAQATADQAKAKADATGNAVATAGAIDYDKRATASGNLAMAMGQAAKANGTAAFAMGHSAIAAGNNAVSLGSASSASARAAVALGGNAKAKHENSVALGEGSETGGTNEVSVGNAATGLKRRVVNVDDARLTDSSTDAVTGKQLFATNEKVQANEAVLAGHGTDLAAQSGRIADNRRDLDALRSEFEDFDPDLDGVVKFAADGGVDIAGGKLRGVAAGDISSATSTDAVNGGQLFETNRRVDKLADASAYLAFGEFVDKDPARAGRFGIAIGDSAEASIRSEGAVAIGAYAAARGANSVALGRGAHVHEGAGRGFALGSESQVAAAGGLAIGGASLVRASALNAVALGAESIADEANTVSVGNGGFQRRMVNLARGINSADAATIAQVRSGIDALGGGATIDASGNIIAPTYNVQGGTQNNVGDALAALDSAVVTAGSRVDSLEGKLRSVFQDSPSVRNDGLNQLTFAGANGMVLSNVANGAIAAGSRDAVNGGQLHSMQQQLNGRMDGLEQRIDGQPQAPQARALTVAAVDSATSSAPVATPAADEPTAPPPSSGDNKVVADAGNAPKSSPQPQADAPKPEAPTPQVDTAELEKMLARANEYSDGISREVDARLNKMDKRFNRMAAMSSAQSAMAMNTAGLNTYNRLGAGVGYSDGESAMAVGYQRVLNEKGSATFSLNGAFTNSGERSMGVGVGIGW